MTIGEFFKRAGWRFWLPAALALLALAATVASLVDPQWIENLFGESPDAGSGESEWWFAVMFGVLAIASAALARWRWRAVSVG